MQTIEPQVLIISNQFDFSTDYIVRGLISKKVPYCRINIDTLPDWSITYDLFQDPKFFAENKNKYLITSNSLKSIFFRAPTFLRSLTKNINGQIDGQWSAFYRSLLLFDDVKWVNSPIATYKAEHKLLQLTEAKKIGLHIPLTLASNNDSMVTKKFSNQNEVMLKSIDALMFRKKGAEAFCYSTPVKFSELNDSSIKSMPIFIQEYLHQKIDYRVTIVGEDVFSVKILYQGKGVSGDWRLRKDEIDFVPYQLPLEIKEKCIKLTRSLGLYFGAIDMVFAKGRFYFIEINPTGEWGWLVDAANQPIDKSFIKLLSTP